MDLSDEETLEPNDKLTRIDVDNCGHHLISKKTVYQHIIKSLTNSDRNHYVLIVFIFVVIVTQIPALVSNVRAGPSSYALLFVNSGSSGVSRHHNASFTNTDNMDSRTIEGNNYVIYLKGEGRFGNIMFQVASGLGIANKNNRKLVVPSRMDAAFRKVFKKSQSNNYVIGNPPKNIPIEAEKLGSFGNEQNRFFSLPNKSVTIKGYFQSWYYFNDISSKIRELYSIRDDLLLKARKVKVEIRKQFNKSDIVFVGVHVRRGDYTSKTHYNTGARLPNTSYITKAMHFFQQKYDDIHFIVCSDDPKWCKKELAIFPNVTVVHGSLEHDLAQLVDCDHMIITYGTFGWWAAWLGGGEVVYFDKPYGGKLEFRNEQMRKRHFLPDWVPMGN